MPSADPLMPSAEWNETSHPFHHDMTIADYLRASAVRTPSSPALVGADGSVIEHGELDSAGDRIARLLQAIGAAPGTFIGLYASRTPATVLWLTGIVKSAAAYVPIDPAWPRARVVAMLCDLGVEILVTDAAHLDEAQEFRWDVPSLRAVVSPDASTARLGTARLERESIEDLFDLLADDPDPIRAAGFNLRQAGHEYTPADMIVYQRHISLLVTDAIGTGASILEVGCGTGLVMEALAPEAGRYVAADPSRGAVRRTRYLAEARGLRIEELTAYAHELPDLVTGRFDAVVLASTVQFFPDCEYFLNTLADVRRLVRPGGAVVLIDLIDPGAEQHPGLRIPPSLITRLPEVIPNVTQASVARRTDDLPGEWACRYDAVIRFGDEPVPTDQATPRRVQSVWSAKDVAATPTGPPTTNPNPGDPAYAIFTSGSTGAPKAVVVAHRAVANLFDWIERCHAVGNDDRLLFVTSFCFDLSVYDMFGVLASGGSVRVASDRELAEPSALIDIIAGEPITIWDSAPAMLAMLTPLLRQRTDIAGSRLRLALLSGDWIPLTTPGELQSAFPGAQVAALGGATECTVWSNQFIVDSIEPEWKSIPYGRPMANAQYHVLDEELQVCPINVPGDLYIAGECLAIGYAGARALTAAKFCANPYGPPGSRMYRTGDRARWRADGEIEFLGRVDDQVKIRGYRIELAEVRGALSRCPGVDAVVAMAVDGPGGKDLAAFYVPTDESVPFAELRAFAGKYLPEYMVPRRIIAVDTLPLTSTGKVDRAALATLL
ncbi:amino acid adenylation domain-containing protein [Catenulispora pinisilvae]|uniref:amino acid adenylation domain-containing protein n=1 Tax=Catenulispora pinisilvae TaxID=2705253 RepID=UPI001890BF0B|nr:amino acid adenylation domain-containing protein [Catenulispora pinisilvae]